MFQKQKVGHKHIHTYTCCLLPYLCEYIVYICRYLHIYACVCARRHMHVCGRTRHTTCKTLHRNVVYEVGPQSSSCSCMASLMNPSCTRVRGIYVCMQCARRRTHTVQNKYLRFGRRTRAALVCVQSLVVAVTSLTRTIPHNEMRMYACMHAMCVHVLVQRHTAPRRCMVFLAEYFMTSPALDQMVNLGETKGAPKTRPKQWSTSNSFVSMNFGHST